MFVMVTCLSPCTQDDNEYGDYEQPYRTLINPSAVAFIEDNSDDNKPVQITFISGETLFVQESFDTLRSLLSDDHHRYDPAAGGDAASPLK